MESLPKRRSIRLKIFDYSSSGRYFITICVHRRQCLLGDIVNGKMVLNNAGKMIQKWLMKIPERFKNTTLDEYQIISNHLHIIIVIGEKMDNSPVGAGFMPARKSGFVPTQSNRATTRVAPTGGNIITLGNIIGAFKSLSTYDYINGVKNKNWQPFNKRLFQHNFYEHIIRNENDLNEIREYIKNNPQMWDRDRNNPKNWKTNNK